MTRPLAVFDIDGVLADVSARQHHLRAKPKNWNGFFRDAVNDARHDEGFDLLRELAVDHDIVFLTGRPERCRRDTVVWLEAAGCAEPELHMRPKNNFGKAADTKTRMLADLVASGRTVAVVIDDDVTVVDAHRSNGFNVTHATWATVGEEVRRAQQVDGRN